MLCFWLSLLFAVALFAPLMLLSRRCGQFRAYVRAARPFFPDSVIGPSPFILGTCCTAGRELSSTLVSHFAGGKDINLNKFWLATLSHFFSVSVRCISLAFFLGVHLRASLTGFASIPLLGYVGLINAVFAVLCWQVAFRFACQFRLSS